MDPLRPRPRLDRRPVAPAAALALLAACTAQSTAAPPAEADAGTAPPPDGGVARCLTPEVGPTPLRRLTRFEYDQTVRDLLGDESRPAAGSFLPDALAFGFDNNALAQAITPALVEQQLHAAESLARRATEDAARLRRLLPCDPAVAGAAPCGHRFIDAFLPRAFRRPLEPGERARFGALFERGLPSGFRTGIRLVIAAALLSPHFLYRLELGAPAAESLVPLTAYELAARLSYLIWGSMPDDPLFAAAAAGRLSSPEGLRAEAERLLADPRAEAGLGHFAEQWLEIQDLAQAVKDPLLYPEGTPEVHAAMRAGALRFHHEVIQGGGSLADLLLSEHAFVNALTAPIYGAGGVSGRALVQVALPAGQRAGLLTDLAVLAAHAKTNQTSPVLRGRFVREQLLCQPLPNPPDNVNTTPPEPREGSTTRERFQEHRTNPSCAACHELMDPLGFGLEAYDAVGRFRLTDGGRPVDQSGRLVGFRGQEHDFLGARELAALLASGPELTQCLSRQWFRYALGRAETGADQCSLEAAGQAGQVRGLLLALVASDAFRLRQSIRAEPGCAP